MSNQIGGEWGGLVIPLQDSPGDGYPRLVEKEWFDSGAIAAARLPLLFSMARSAAPAGSIDATVSVSAITATFSVQQPQVVSNHTATPAVVTGALTVIDPAVSIVAGVVASAVVGSFTAITPSVISNHTATLTALTLVGTLGVPIVSGNSLYVGTALVLAGSLGTVIVSGTALTIATVRTLVGTLGTVSVSGGTGSVVSTTNHISVGAGYSDVSMKQLVRTSANRLYIIVPNCDSYPDFSATGLTQTIRVYKGNTTGEPSSFSRMDSANEPAAVVGCASAIDGSDNIHIAWSARSTVSNTQYLRYAVFSTSTDTWGSVTTIASDLAYDDSGQGDENASIAIDSAGKAHIVYLTTVGGTKATRRCYYVNNVGGSWSTPFEVDSGTSYTGNFKAWHPNIVFDTTGRIVVAFHVGTFNDTADGTVYVRTRETGGSWNTQVQVSASSGALTSIDGSTSMVVDQNNMYHIVYVNASLTPGNKYIRYRYSSDNGGTWNANDPASGLQATHNPSLGLGANSKLRIWAHGTPDGANHGINLYYFEGLGGANSWGSWTLWFTGSTYDCSVNTRWSQFFHNGATYLDVIYWDDAYPNQLFYGLDVLGSGSVVTVTPSVVTGAFSLNAVTVTGTALTTITALTSSGVLGTPVVTGTALTQPTAIVGTTSALTPLTFGDALTLSSVITGTFTVQTVVVTTSGNDTVVSTVIVGSFNTNLPAISGSALQSPSVIVMVGTPLVSTITGAALTTITAIVGALSLQAVQEISNHTATLTAIPVVGSFGNVTISGTALTILTALTGAFSPQAVVVLMTALIQPTVVTGLFTVQTPVVNSSGSTTVQPTFIALVGSIPVPVIKYDYKLTITALVGALSLQAVQEFGSALSILTALTGAFSVVAPVVSSGSSTTVSPVNVNGSLSVNAPQTFGTSVTSPSALTASSILQSVGVVGTATAVAPNLVGNFSFINPNVSTANFTLVQPDVVNLPAQINDPDLVYDSILPQTAVELQSTLNYPSLRIRRIDKTFNVWQRQRMMRDRF